jgi:hypothetical protein
MKKKYLPILLLAVAFVGLALGADALAQNYGLDDAAGSKIPKGKDLASLIGSILRAALGLVGTIFLLLMLYAGFQWMTARGDSKKVEDAKKLITGAIVGVLIIASAYAVTSFVLTAVTSGGGTPAPTSENSSCLPSKCVNNSDCGDTACYTGVCRCINGGSPPCNDAGGQDGQCVMK